MANRYANLVGSNKIKDEYQKINIGFDKVEQEMDEKPDNSFAKINDVEAEGEDAVTIEAGTGITVTTTPEEKKIRITATGEAAPGPHGSEHNHDGSDPIPDLVQLKDDLNAHLNEKAQDDVHSLLSDGKIIEESGSNANGHYVRFADGTQICTRRVNVDLSSRDSVWRYSIVSGGVGIALPASFVSLPACSFSLVQNPYGGGGVSLNSVFANMFIGSSTNSTVYLAGTEEIEQTREFIILAIGRWK